MLLKSIWLFAAIQAVSAENAADEATASQPAFELFKTICFDAFPDPAAAAEAIATHPAGFVKIEKSGMSATQPGDAWTSGDITVTYVDADWLPRDLPSPQCSVSVPLTAGASHSEIATAFGSNFDLPKGKIGKDKPRSISRWDMPGEGKDTWRIFLATEPDGQGSTLQISLLNLRAKK